MLIEFTVKNFKSIQALATLSAEPGERLRRLRRSNTLTAAGVPLLKSLLVVGPNGAGKTTLLDALRTLRELVVHPRTRVTEPLPYDPFQLGTGCSTAPTELAVHFTTGESVYRYELAYDAERVVAETLTTWVRGRAQVVFARQTQTFTVLPAGLAGLAQVTKPNSLVLFNAQAANNAHAIAAFRWLEEDLVFVDNDAPLARELVALMAVPALKREFLRFLRFADFNITDIQVREVPRTLPVALVESMRRELGGVPAALEATEPMLYTSHKRYNAAGDVVGQVELPLTSESRGTQKVFSIALSLIQAQLSGHGRTLVFDEFDDALHLELSKALLAIFNSEPNRNQFLITTHELQLLDNQLRIDQLYLIEKDFRGATTLRSIFDFSDSRVAGRPDISYMKRYIEGRFGAMPQLSVVEMLNALMAVERQGATED